MVSKQTLWFAASLFTKTFFQTTKTPKIIFENNTWPHLVKAVLDKASFSFPWIQSTQLQTELRWQSCLTSDGEHSQNAAKTFFPNISLDIYLIIDEKTKNSLLVICSHVHVPILLPDVKSISVGKSHLETQPNPMAFERDPKIGLARTSHFGDGIVASCSTHKNNFIVLHLYGYHMLMSIAINKLMVLCIITASDIMWLYNFALQLASNCTKSHNLLISTYFFKNCINWTNLWAKLQFTHSFLITLSLCLQVKALKIWLKLEKENTKQFALWNYRMTIHSFMVSHLHVV